MKALTTIILIVVFSVLQPAVMQAQSASFAVGASAPEYFGDPRLWYAAGFRFAGPRNLAFEAEMGYWRSSHSRDLCLLRGNICSHSEDRQRDLNAGFNTLYVMTGKRLGVSFGGGAGAHFLKRESSFVTQLDLHNNRVIKDSSVEPDLHLVGSLDIAVNSRFVLFIGQRTEFIRHLPDEWKAFGGIRYRF